MTGGAYSRRKGSRWEVAVANFLSSRGHPATTTRNSRGGRQAGVDIDAPTLPYAVECKDQQRWSLPAWWAQAEAQATDGRVPLLVVKRPGTADVAESLAVLRLGDLIGDADDGHSTDLELLRHHLREARAEIDRLRGER